MKGMKLSICVMLALLWAGGVHGQESLLSPSKNLQQLADAVASYGRHYPQELVFLHMDNTCYFLGDTIYYKAYVERSDMCAPTNISQVLYADLFNQDGYLVERQTIRLQNGSGEGSFCLPDSLYAGFYELRAYTRWQLNWGVCDHPHTKYAEKWFLKEEMARDFFRDYDKLYSRVFPVYDKPMADTVPERKMTLRPLRRYYKQQERSLSPQVSLFPEGGNWVEEMPTRIAFEASSSDGSHLDGTLFLYDSNRREVARGEVVHAGRGMIEVTTVAGESYKAEFMGKDGNVFPVELPDRQQQGVAMHVGREDGRLCVRLARRNMDSQPLGMTVMHHGVVKYYCEVEDDPVYVSLDSLPEGVAQLTLFDSGGRIWADRLYFVSHGKNTRLSRTRIDGVPEMCEPFAPIKMTLSGMPNATVSVAVRDKALCDALYDNNSLYTELLLSSQIKGFVENPAYYFEQDDGTHRAALDLLLMVQGWRRYAWQEMKEPFQLLQPYEISPVIMGDVHKYTALDQEDYFYVSSADDPGQLFQNASGGTSGPLLIEPVNIIQSNHFMESLLEDGMELGLGIYNSRRLDPRDYQYLSEIKNDVYVHAQYAQPFRTDNNQAVETVATKNGQFALQTPHSYTPYFAYLAASKLPEMPQLVNNADQYPDYSLRVIPFHPRFVRPYSYYQTHLMQDLGDAVRPQEGVNMINELTVGANRNGLRPFKGSKPAFVVDAYQAFNEVVDAGLSPAWYAGAQSLSIALARLYIGEMGVRRRYQLERRWDGHNMTHNVSMEQQHRCNHLCNLKRIAVYTDYAPRQEGDPRYEASNQPMVTVDMVTFEDNRQRITYRDRRYVFSGYNVCEDFYQPDYSHKPLPSHKDYRRTIYWNPSLQLGKDGKAKVKFYNNCRQNHLSVSVEGIMPDGTILSASSDRCNGMMSRKASIKFSPVGNTSGE